MKKASLVFQYIPIVLNIIVYIVAAVLLINNPEGAGEFSVPFLLTLWAIEIAVGIVFSVLCIVTLHKDKKVIAFGVLSLIFSGFLGVLFYLLWKPVKAVENK